ncbi:Uu.00g129730.m01.CDS01 [Anthostomella pinea]|uniref:Uu.00g129730.m01.CDS01 n=1 Tax=Anthostomella pinea TaxID=933095 RepID=A0AAI8YI34_9PEZI|nr:Uu.00g129730.m01.CDS01 [Anthostomella pinea]
MHPAFYIFTLLGAFALSSESPWSNENCKVCASCQLPQDPDAVPKEEAISSYPSSSWLLATCNGIESMLDLDDCLSVNDHGQLILQDKGQLSAHKSPQHSCSPCCSYGLTADESELLAGCNGLETSSLPLSQAVNITAANIMTCLNHTGTVVPNTDPATTEHRELVRGMQANTTTISNTPNTTTSSTPAPLDAPSSMLTSVSNIDAPATGCASVPTRAFRPPNSTGSICDNTTITQVPVTGGEAE